MISEPRTTNCELSRYQLDLLTPGISPFNASDRKHKRQTPNLRRKARGRPQSWHLLCLRLLNFGFRASFTRFAVVAIKPQLPPYASWRKGIPKWRSSARAWLSSFAVVTIVMFMPFSFSTLE
jgi:hypothetical protein